ncbi:endonuclease/exonuclease/phosphatase family protein [uncultured Pseudoteredinibacter sp.]|uniref:endonuclease/exonuclease/phosphatase family protein n=1 Tax=uncultured Pseudoteredinibacter sp. TaxID=1641701 RepID=UPI002638D1AF|nr:endonuclease/exonuclease/phosphatase family protein [uncultured Pseudoteredinibacter sp.]
MQKQLRIATFNVSMEASNYPVEGNSIYQASRLTEVLKEGKQIQLRNIAEIIQRVRPDVILLNEFDYIENEEDGIGLFVKKYLQQSQNRQEAINYPYIYINSVNTGVETGLNAKDSRLSHFGFGRYPGQFGMALLSKYPIEESQVRTFQKFLWKDMPDNLLPTDKNGKSWYSTEDVNIMRLSSKSHWDVPLNINGTLVSILASHPTPPVFDGPEDRNGRRNHDEIRFWKDYIAGDKNSYHYDDAQQKGGIAKIRDFVILGDLNASANEGDAYPGTMNQLLEHPAINDYPAPSSDGGSLNKAESPYAKSHTAAWGMRADYVLPSKGLKLIDSGVFWPKPDSKEAYLVADRNASSDHRLVWVDIENPALKNCPK